MMKPVVLVLLVLVALVPASAQETTAVEPSPALLEHVAELEAATTEIRGLAALEPVDRRFPNREQVAEFLAGQFADEDTRQAIVDSEFIYKAFGLLEADIDLLSVYQALLESQVGGYYDPETKEMNTLLITAEELTDQLPLLERIVYVHEYTHALQDQYYDLGALLSDELTETSPDGALAIQALVEGDATQVMTDYLTQLTLANPDEVLSQMSALTSTAASMEIPAGTPQILTDELLFPYMQGQIFVQALVEDGGYARVDEAFANPPVSSEQIIHPEKYLAGELPIEVTLDSALDILGEGWELHSDYTAGEYFLRNWLRPGLGAFDLATAASGWGGDRYHVYSDTDGQAAFRWLIVFDTPEDEEQFAERLPRALNYQHGDENSDGTCWTTEGGFVLCFAVQADGGVLITRAPSADLALALLG